ncbi:putative molybdenum carrier protein [Nocardioides sp. AN3]
MRIRRIMSGGQTGVDRGALDAAKEAGRAYGGWCPSGGLAEDRPEPPGLLADYPELRSTPSSDPAERTRRNIRDSDATLVIRADGSSSPGTDLTIETADRLGRPCLVTEGDPDAVLAWLDGLGSDLTVNVAGPRESEQPDGYRVAYLLLQQVLEADR